MASSPEAAAKALRLLRAISDAFESRDWTTLRSLYRDDARITAVAAGHRTLSPDELVEVLSAAESRSYATDDAETAALDENAVVVWGLVVQRDEGATTFMPSAWVLTFRDGLVWRSKAYESVDEGRAAYAAYGLDLDM
jgi:ketosteroid isomerase-like protein